MMPAKVPLAKPMDTPAAPMRLSAVTAIMLSMEFVAASATAYLTSTFYHYTTLQSEPATYVLAAVYIAGLILTISVGFRHFGVIQRQPLHLLLGNGLIAVAAAFSLFLSTLFLLKGAEEYSRGSFVLQVIAVATAVCIVRTMFFFWVQSAIGAGLIAARHVVLIGDEASRIRFADLVRTTGIRSVTSLPFPLHDEPAGESNKELVNLQAARATIESCRLANADDVVILASAEELAAAPELARILSELPVSVHIVPFGMVNFFGTSRIAELGDLKTLEVSRPPLSSFDRAVKRTFDIVVATAGLVLLAPLFAIVAIAVKLESRGGVLYWQERHGYNNTVIRVAKFRSMYCDEGRERQAFVQAKRCDARITHVGRILRRTNIDELPQLLNVVFGNMSIVGPRPHATAHNAMFEDRILPFSRRHNIKPGITGWAQVNGHRGETDTLEKMQRRVEHDLYYIDNWSFFLDLKIILLTLFSRRAYMNAY